MVTTRRLPPRSGVTTFALRPGFHPLTDVRVDPNRMTPSDAIATLPKAAKLHIEIKGNVAPSLQERFMGRSANLKSKSGITHVLQSVR